VLLGGADWEETKAQLEVVEKVKALGLPVSKDYVYQVSQVPPPDGPDDALAPEPPGQGPPGQPPGPGGPPPGGGAPPPTPEPPTPPTPPTPADPPAATFSDAHDPGPDDVAAAVDDLIAEFRGYP
jgi:hypothetical protein